jgi:hypothetical protein
MEDLFPEDKPETDESAHKEIRKEVNRDYSEPDDQPFAESEVIAAFGAQNPKKSLGEDGITADIIKELHSIDPSFLTLLYNKYLVLHTFPKNWKTSIVKVLRKPNKTDYRKTDSYRPISLTSVFSKILEKLLINRIVYFMHSNKLLSERQYGFTPQKLPKTRYIR